MTEDREAREEAYSTLLQELYAASELMHLGRYHSAQVKGYVKRAEPWELHYLQLWLENILADRSTVLASAFAPYERSHELLRDFLGVSDESYLLEVLELRSTIGTSFSYNRYPEDEFFYETMSAAVLANNSAGYSELYQSLVRFVHRHEEQVRLHHLWEAALEALEKLEVKMLLRGYTS